MFIASSNNKVVLNLRKFKVNISVIKNGFNSSIKVCGIANVNIKNNKEN